MLRDGSLPPSRPLVVAVEEVLERLRSIAVPLDEEAGMGTEVDGLVPLLLSVMVVGQVQRQ